VGIAAGGATAVATMVGKRISKNISKELVEKTAKVAEKIVDIKVIGRLNDTEVAKNWKNHDVLNISDWTMKKDMEWVDQGIANKQNFYTASPKAENMIQTSGRFKGQPTVYAKEIQKIEKNAGYTKKGDYYVHPDNVETFKK
jgi:hypothetical protein